MNDYNKITALYSRLSVGDEDRDGGESNSIQNQKIFLENYARGQRLTNIRHYIDDDESGRFFDRSAYGRTERDAHRTPERRQYHHDAEERADHCCGVIFQSQQHRNIPRQAAQDDTCRQFAFIRV